MRSNVLPSLLAAQTRGQRMRRNGVSPPSKAVGNLNHFGLTPPDTPDKVPPLRAEAVMVDVRRPNAEAAFSVRSEDQRRSPRGAEHLQPGMDSGWPSSPDLGPTTPLIDTLAAVPSSEARRAPGRHAPCRPIWGGVGSRIPRNEPSRMDALSRPERLSHRVGSTRDKVRQVDRSRILCRGKDDARLAQEAPGATSSSTSAGFKEFLCTGCSATSS
ncbi:MAG: hypothetical protein JWN86_2559 [Planctomycetota bacterium]|nr:hypothetical protein [Planctomycetota bacterium]